MGDVFKQDTLVFYCNGRKISEPNPDPAMSLAVYIRTTLQLKGCKIGCGVGGCGACTVMLSSYSSKTISHIAVNSCLYPLCALHGKAVTTVEGLGSTKTKLHAVQDRLAKAHGSQCGFCSPGMVMSMYTLLRNSPIPNTEQILQAMEGNLCRCTGYRPILDAFNTFTKGGGCCKEKSAQECCKTNNTDMCSDLFKVSDFMEYDPTQDIIFPPELLTNTTSMVKTNTFIGDSITWINATSIENILLMKSIYPSAWIIAGNTANDISKYKGVVIYVGNVHEINDVTTTDIGLKVGANVTLAQLQDAIIDLRKTLPVERMKTLNAIETTLHRFASQQIRNVATIGGHIVAARAGYELIPILLAVGAKIMAVKSDGSCREINMDDELYSLLKGTVMTNDEILQGILIPFTTKNDYVESYKTTRRRSHMDNAVVNAAFHVTFKPGCDVISMARLVFDGFQDTPTFTPKTAEQLIGRAWDKDCLKAAGVTLRQELAEHRTSDNEMIMQYRIDLADASFVKFFISTNQLLSENQATTCVLSLSDNSIMTKESSKIPHATALYQPVPDGQPDIDPIGRPIVHRAALQQTSGEAIYVDDLPLIQGELHLALVLPTRGRARIVSIDTKEALAIEGVVTFISADDVPGINKSLLDDEQIFVTEEVYSVSQILGAIVATSPEVAHQAAKLVRVTYEELPVITTIEEAIEQKAFYPDGQTLQKGDVDMVFKSGSVTVVEGTVRTSAQEHYYLEPTACIAVPSGEAGEMELRLGWQEVMSVQYSVAKTLGVEANKINCRTKRAGGSFGGKANRCIWIIACAVAANKTSKAVRMVLPRDIDMQISGNREASMGKYRVAFDSTTGKILAADVTIYTNWGSPGDIQIAITGNILFAMDVVYSMDNFRASVVNCTTNIPSAKPMRTFGSVESLFVMESILSDVAVKCDIPVLQVRETNMHKVDVPSTYFGLPINDYNVFTRCWKDCIDNSDYNNRRVQIDAYNRENRWNKRGLALLPVRFDIGAYPVFLHQASAMVNAYIDGSVLVHHGGVEVGQGIHTKMIQIASRVLGLDVNKIHIAESCTNVSHNATDIGASHGTDMWGMAVKSACETIIERLEPFKSGNPNGTFADWVKAAYMSRVNLSSIGFYKTPGVDWNWDTKTGRPFQYSTFGAACSEVQIDCLTGNHQLLRTDIVMDVGKSLNPALDVGQIEGAFMMGYGYFAFEELLWSKDGNLITNGPHNYKIPCVRDIPAEFNITLLRNCPNPRAVYSSKGIGEPPFCLASSVYFAIHDAIHSARAGTGKPGMFSLDLPATADKIRKACSGGDTLLNNLTV